jgi:RNA recognition motif-containing protein
MPEDAKVHVGNLSFDTREDDLMCEFERYGRVEQGLHRRFVNFSSYKTWFHF